MANEEYDVIELKDEEGNTFSFEHLLTFEVDNDFFIAMTPVESFDGLQKDEVLIMKIVDDEDGERYLPIETKEELDVLWDIFQDIYYADDEEEAQDEK